MKSNSSTILAPSLAYVHEAHAVQQILTNIYFEEQMGSVLWGKTGESEFWWWFVLTCVAAHLCGCSYRTWARTFYPGVSMSITMGFLVGTLSSTAPCLVLWMWRPFLGVQKPETTLLFCEELPRNLAVTSRRQAALVFGSQVPILSFIKAVMFESSTMSCLNPQTCAASPEQKSPLIHPGCAGLWGPHGSLPHSEATDGLSYLNTVCSSEMKHQYFKCYEFSGWSPNFTAQ